MLRKVHNVRLTYRVVAHKGAYSGAAAPGGLILGYGLIGAECSIFTDIYSIVFIEVFNHPLRFEAKTPLEIAHFSALSRYW